MWRRLLSIAVVVALLAGVVVALELTGLFCHNEAFAYRYAVSGLDISHHQGPVDWHAAAKDEAVGFVWMKATEGHDFADPRFAENWAGARARGVPAGAYHFFSMRSPGERQARHFARTVPRHRDALAPMIDVEVSLDHDPAVVRREVRDLAEAMQARYGRAPVLYVTHATYGRYVEGHLGEYAVWIRDVVRPPSLGDRRWHIWQYCSTGRVDGIDGAVDLNVFAGTPRQFADQFGRLPRGVRG